MDPVNGIFLDSSALIKLFVTEHGSENVETLVKRASRISVSILAEFEFLSTIQRLKLDGVLADSQVQQLHRDFETVWSNLHYKEPLSQEIFTVSRQLIGQHRLRTLDSFQLASAIVLQTRISSSLTFVTADKGLGQCARREGFEVYDPNLGRHLT